MTGRLILVGMPASGKTTVGQALAQALAVPLYDCDREVEQVAGRTIPAIFAGEGEAAFRALEREVLERLCAMDAPCVVATGGGAVLSAENRVLLERSGTVFWLDRALESIMSTDTADRPLLAGGESALRAMYAQRRRLYESCARHRVPDGTVQQATDYILRIVEGTK